ncbi:lengsin-like [Lytechinus pictus]|uniref:lengsin-like n=1 Tax=Lytechinus pictus TaxID=7653 RepID=UPI0030BA294D
MAGSGAASASIRCWMSSGTKGPASTGWTVMTVTIRQYSGFPSFSSKWTPGRTLSRWPLASASPDQSPLQVTAAGDLKTANADELHRLLVAHKFDYIRFEQSDMHGLAKCKLVPITNVKGKMTKGINFSLSHMIRDPHGTKVRGTGLWYEKGMGDGAGVPDLSSFRVLPWCDGAARIIVDLTVDGEPLDAHPRNIARRQVEELDSMGISLLAAHEFEFVVEDEKTRMPIFDGLNCGYLMNISRAESLVQQFTRHLPRMGLNVETVESEAGAGQLEITYRPTSGLSIGDNGYTLKTSVKEICQRQGYVASFRSKHSKDCTSSSHFCHSLWDRSNTTSLLYDPHHPQMLSKLGQHWLAGLIHHAPALTLLMCPTINCINRLGTTPSTPTTTSWGVDNRSCAFRLSKPPKDGNPDSFFIENRMGGAGSNPYLTMAATIAAGIDGIRNEIPLPAPVQGVASSTSGANQKLPRTMKESLDAFHADNVVLKAMGRDFVQCFTALKEEELRLHHRAEENGDHSWHYAFVEHI